MALETTITPWHVATALGQPAPTSYKNDQWQLWIDDQLMFIQDRALSLKVPDSALDQAKIDFVIREVVADQVRRRRAVTDSDEHVDAYQFRTVADWWPLLGLTDSTGSFSIDMTPTATVHLPWCSSMFGAVYCSCGADIAGRPIYEGGDDL